MNDLALFALVKAVIETGLAANDLSDVAVAQSYQPTQQGANYERTVYLHKISDNRYGFPLRKDEWVVDKMVHTETVIMETTFQVAARVLADPSDITALTASDLTNFVGQIIQSDVALATFKAQNVGIYRVTALRQIYLENDYQRNEVEPSFDFTLTHQRSLISESPILQSVDFEIYRT
jgi:hypothetical protein